MIASLTAPANLGPTDAPAPRLMPRTVDRSTTAGTIRVAIAHGRPSLRARLRVTLDRAVGIAVVVETASGEDTVALAPRVRADVVLLDVRLPGLDCVEATRRLRADGSSVVLVSSGEADHRVFAALQAGADGLLLERTEPSDLIRAITLLGQGRPLRPRRPARRRPFQEETMLTPKVIEIRRGSAHGAAARLATAASAARRQG
jgi:DNA-binding NarL/FixJ family response regulator